MHLIPEVGLEWPAPVCQAGPVLISHLMLLLAGVADPDVMPHTQADCVGVLVRSDADPAPAIRYVLDRSVSVEVPHEQAGKTAAMMTNYL